MSSRKHFQLFEGTSLCFKNKFFILMDLLVTNQGTSHLECAIFLGIFHLQIIVGFFSNQVKLLSPSTSSFDNLLQYMEKILRLKNLFNNDYDSLQITIIISFVLLSLSVIYFLLLIHITSKKSFYSTKEVVMNFIIKVFIYVAFNIILDSCLINFCFQTNNSYIRNAKCNFSSNPKLFTISIILILLSIIVMLFLQIYNNDTLFLFNSCYSKIACGYEIYYTCCIIIYSLLLNQIEVLSSYLFLIYNIFSSILLCFFYFKVYLYYDRFANSIVGIFHVLYVWESLFFMIDKLVTIDNSGIVFVISSVFIIWFFFILKRIYENNILYKTPFNKIKNKYHLQYYIKTLIDKINLSGQQEEERALLVGILQMHIIECPNEQCLTKTTEKIFLPRTGEWSQRDKDLINDKIFLSHFIIVIMNFFLKQNYYSPDIIINISLYYLKIIGNVCQSIYFCKKVNEMKMSLVEDFSYQRLQLIISKTLIEKLKSENEACFQLEDLNTSLFFKYDELSSKFISEMENDIKYTSNFWDALRNGKSNSINFNEIFHLTDKIRLTKMKVENLFNNLFSIFNGVNDLFDLYLNYVETVNDDDLTKRDLENIRRKNDNNTNDILHLNYYNFLFSKDTGIIIVNGDKGKEGIIERTNKTITEIFGYDKEELKGMNVSSLMPKSIERKHKNFMERYFEIGEKRILDKKDFKSFGKDKDNSIFSIKLMIKLFPILNENVHFVSLVLREKIDDIILTDALFNIEGMSSRLFNKLNIYAKNLFVNYEIPFYIICPKFITFYQNFVHTKKKNVINIERKKRTMNTSNNILTTNKTTNVNDSNINSHFGSVKTHDREALRATMFPVLKQLALKPSSSNVIENITEEKKEEEEEVNNPLNHINTINLNLNVDITETSEMEYEIHIPLFISNFINYLSAKKANQENMIEHEELNENNSMLDDSGLNEESNTEKTSLIKNEDDKVKTPTPNTPTPKTPITPNQFSSTILSSQILTILSPRKKDSLINMGINNSKLPEEEIEFIQKLNEHKVLFYKGNFDELEIMIKSATTENNAYNSVVSEGFKFNFTFDRYKFGLKSQAYVIRCIENKNDFDGSDDTEESLGNRNLQKITTIMQNEFTHLLRKSKNESLSDVYEILNEEKQQLIELQAEFFKLSVEDTHFRKLLAKNQDEIFKLSHIHGVKKQETLIDDENSSQSSQVGYNEDLSKKNRIEEIRSSALKNVNSFYMLKYYRITVLIFLIITIVFIFLYQFYFLNICDRVEDIADLNNKLFLTSNWIAYLISSLMSLRTLYEITKEGMNVNYNTYISDKEEYVYTMKNYSIEWINEIADNFAIVEKNIGKYLNETGEYLWEKEEYNLNNKQNESFPLYLSKIISNANSLLRDENFIECILHNKTVQGIELYNIGYNLYMAISNAYITFIPIFIEKLEGFPILFKDYISSSLDSTISLILIYSAFLFAFIVCYSFITYLTNKNIGEGFEKVSKIKIDKIEETKKKIDGFSSILNKYIEYNYHYTSAIFYDAKNVTDIPHEIIKMKTLATIQGEGNDNNNNTSTISGVNNEKNVLQSRANQNLNPNNTSSSLNITNDYLNTSSSITSSLVGAQAINETISNKKLRLLTKSYAQPLIIVIIIYCIILPIFFLIKRMNTLDKELIEVQSYFFSSIFIATEQLIKMKMVMSNFYNDSRITMEIVTDTKFDLNNTVIMKKIISSISNFYDVFSFYSKMRVGVCDVIYDINTESYTQCSNDPLIKSINNTNSILDNIPYRLSLIGNKYKTNQNGRIQSNPYLLFEDENYKEIENLVYNYLTPLSEQLANVTMKAITIVIHNTKVVTNILTGVILVAMIIFSLYILIWYLDTIVHLLSVSRCVLTIIPICVINSTPELENWIENKY